MATIVNIQTVPTPPTKEGVSFPAMPTTGTLWSMDHRQAPYDAYLVMPVYLYDSGAIQMPVAGPAGTPCEFVQLRAPFGAVIVAWYGRRVGYQPVAPDPNPPSGSRYVLLGAAVSPPSPRLQADGTTYVWTVAGAYVYGLTLPFVPGKDTLQVPAPPYQKNVAPTIVYGPENFRQTIFSLSPGA